MAKGCISHAIEVDMGKGWTPVLKFRETEEKASRLFDVWTKEKIRPDISARLVEVRVLKQKNRGAK